MYSLIRSTPLRGLIANVTPSFVISFAIAEFFFKFKSFALECIAFLLTWLVLDAILAGLNRLWQDRSTQ